MTVYHGSTVSIPEPRIIRGDRIGDFGIGFYTTTDFEQARRFVLRKCAIEGVDHGYVSVYSVPDDILSRKDMKALKFDGADETWVKFVFANRRDPDFVQDNDLVYGPVANDQVYASLSLFEDGQIGYEELIRRLMSRKLVDQILFHTEKALTLLRYVTRLEVSCPTL